MLCISKLLLMMSGFYTVTLAVWIAANNQLVKGLRATWVCECVYVCVLHYVMHYVCMHVYKGLPHLFLYFSRRLYGIYRCNLPLQQATAATESEQSNYPNNEGVAGGELHVSSVGKEAVGMTPGHRWPEIQKKEVFLQVFCKQQCGSVTEWS